MRRACLITVAAFLALLQRAGAQEPGERIRLTVETPVSQRVVGMFVAGDRDSLWLELPGQPARVGVARMAVTRVEVSRGRARGTIRGAELGAGLGAIGGFVVGGVAASRDACNPSAFVNVCAAELYGRALRGALIGAAAGGVVGAALGALVRTERWAGMPLSHVRLVVLAPSRARLAMSFPF